MSVVKIVAILAIVAGCVGLVYGRINFARESHTATVGNISLTAREDRGVDVPMWAAIAAIVGGGLVLMTGRRASRS